MQVSINEVWTSSDIVVKFYRVILVQSLVFSTNYPIQWFINSTFTSGFFTDCRIYIMGTHSLRVYLAHSVASVITIDYQYPPI